MGLSGGMITRDYGTNPLVYFKFIDNRSVCCAGQVIDACFTAGNCRESDNFRHQCRSDGSPCIRGYPRGSIPILYTVAGRPTVVFGQDDFIKCRIRTKVHFKPLTVPATVTCLLVRRLACIECFRRQLIGIP